MGQRYKKLTKQYGDRKQAARVAYGRKKGYANNRYRNYRRG